MEKGVDSLEEDELYQALYEKIIAKSCSTNPFFDRIMVRRHPFLTLAQHLVVETYFALCYGDIMVAVAVVLIM